MGSDNETGYCLRCRYDLRSCQNLVCSECGRAFDPSDATTFFRPGMTSSWRLRAMPPSLWHLLAVPIFSLGQRSRPQPRILRLLGHWILDDL